VASGINTVASTPQAEARNSTAFALPPKSATNPNAMLLDIEHPISLNRFVAVAQTTVVIPRASSMSSSSVHLVDIWSFLPREGKAQGLDVAMATFAPRTFGKHVPNNNCIEEKLFSLSFCCALRGTACSS
jgi:hypothetical protein